MEYGKEDRKKLEEYISQQAGGDVCIVEDTDTFDFKCQKCGQCCMGRDDIVLTPFDVYNACVALNIGPADFIDKYTTLTIGTRSKLPVITLKPDHKGWCHFLELDIKNGGCFKCSINDNKPGACRNHPIGVVTSFKKEKNAEGDKREIYTEIYIKVDQCENSKGHNNPVLVSDWMQKSKEFTEERKWANKIQLLPSEKINIPRFFKLLAQTSQGPDNIEDWSESERESIYNIMEKSINIMKNFIEVIVGCTYCSYDITKPFVEQVKNSYNKLDEICSQIGQFYSQLEESFITTGGNIKDLDE